MATKASPKLTVSDSFPVFDPAGGLLSFCHSAINREAVQKGCSENCMTVRPVARVFCQIRKVFICKSLASGVTEDREDLESKLRNLFGDTIYTYSDSEAIEDGVLIPFISGGKDTGHRVTRPAFEALSEHYTACGYASYGPNDFYRFFYAELQPLIGAARELLMRLGES